MKCPLIDLCPKAHSQYKNLPQYCNGLLERGIGKSGDNNHHITYMCSEGVFNSTPESEFYLLLKDDNIKKDFKLITKSLENID